MKSKLSSATVTVLLDWIEVVPAECCNFLWDSVLYYRGGDTTCTSLALTCHGCFTTVLFACHTSSQVLPMGQACSGVTVFAVTELYTYILSSHVVGAGN